MTTGAAMRERFEALAKARSYCVIRAANGERRNMRPRILKCEKCNAAFESQTGFRLYCDECIKAFAATAIVPREVTCPHCGLPFEVQP